MKPVAVEHSFENGRAGFTCIAGWDDAALGISKGIVANKLGKDEFLKLAFEVDEILTKAYSKEGATNLYSASWLSSDTTSLIPEKKLAPVIRALEEKIKAYGGDYNKYMADDSSPNSGFNLNDPASKQKYDEYSKIYDMAKSEVTDESTELYKSLNSDDMKYSLNPNLDAVVKKSYLYNNLIQKFQGVINQESDNAREYVKSLTGVEDATYMLGADEGPELPEPSMD